MRMKPRHYTRPRISASDAEARIHLLSWQQHKKRRRDESRFQMVSHSRRLLSNAAETQFDVSNFFMSFLNFTIFMSGQHYVPPQTLDENTKNEIIAWCRVKAFRELFDCRWAFSCLESSASASSCEPVEARSWLSRLLHANCHPTRSSEVHKKRIEKFNIMKDDDAPKNTN